MCRTWFLRSRRAARREDELFKPKTYAEIGVKELFLFDPTNDYLNPPLQGYRLEASGQVRLAMDASGALECQELGLFLRLQGRRLILEDRTTGRPLRTEAEAEHEAREAAESNAEAAEARARAAIEAEVNQLREQLRQQRSGNG